MKVNAYGEANTMNARSSRMAKTRSRRN